MIDIPLNAEIHCSDGPIGRCTHVIVNPITRLITHLVVKSSRPPFGEYRVPMNQVEGTEPRLIMLQCSWNDVKKMERFVLEEYIDKKVPDFELWRDGYLAWPMVLPAAGYQDLEHSFVPVEHENTLPGELSVHRGAHVEATDGPLGQVDELLVNSNNMQVTHLILRGRHALKQIEVAIPVSQIDHIEEDRVYLKLDKKGIGELPTVPVQRWAK